MTNKEVERVLSTIKGLLRSSGLTYADVARKLEVSEPTVKRMMSGETEMTVTKLAQLCRLLNVDLFELMKLARFGSPQTVPLLTPEQERVLSEDDDLFSLFYLLTLGFSYDVIRRNYTWTEPQLEKLLLALEKVGIAQKVDKKIKMLIPRKSRWSHGGPLHRKYMIQMTQDFSRNLYEAPSGSRFFFNYPLSPKSQIQVEEKIATLVQEIERLSEIEIMSTDEKDRSCMCIFTGSQKNWMPEPVRRLAKQRGAAKTP